MEVCTRKYWTDTQKGLALHRTNTQKRSSPKLRPIGGGASESTPSAGQVRFKQPCKVENWHVWRVQLYYDHKV